MWPAPPPPSSPPCPPPYPRLNRAAHALIRLPRALTRRGGWPQTPRSRRCGAASVACPRPRHFCCSSPAGRCCWAGWSRPRARGARCWAACWQAQPGSRPATAVAAAVAVVSEATAVVSEQGPAWEGTSRRRSRGCPRCRRRGTGSRSRAWRPSPRHCRTLQQRVRACLHLPAGACLCLPAPPAPACPPAPALARLHLPTCLAAVMQCCTASTPYPLALSPHTAACAQTHARTGTHRPPSNPPCTAGAERKQQQQQQEDANASSSPAAGAGGGSGSLEQTVQQAATAVQWIVAEATALPPDVRVELLQLPLQLASRVRACPARGCVSRPGGGGAHGHCSG